MSKTRAEELPIWESQVTRGWHYSVETHGMLCGTITMRTKPCTFPNDHGRLIFEATYKTALTNTFVLTQRLTEVRYRPRPHQPLSAGRAAPLPARVFAKGKQAITPACTSHRKTRPASLLFEGVGDLVLWTGLSRGVKEPHCCVFCFVLFYNNILSQPLGSVKASSPLTLRA